MKNKILIFALIFILVLTNCVCAFADDSTLVEDVLANYPDIPTGYTDTIMILDNFIYNDIEHDDVLIMSKSDMSITLCANSVDFYVSGSSSIYIFVVKNNAWVHDYTYSDFRTSLDNIVYLNQDILNGDGSVAFPHSAPITLTGLTSREIQKMTMIQIVGLVPLVIGLVALVIGLKKALRLLYLRLHQA